MELITKERRKEYLPQLHPLSIVRYSVECRMSRQSCHSSFKLLRVAALSYSAHCHTPTLSPNFRDAFFGLRILAWPVRASSLIAIHRIIRTTHESHEQQIKQRTLEK